MAMSTLNTINEIVEYIVKNFNDLDSNTQETLIDLVNQSVIKVENSIGDTIDTNSIPNKYQPIIIDLSYSNVILFDINQDGACDIKLGPMTINNDAKNRLELARELKQGAMDSLLELKRRLKFKRVIGSKW